jgi:integrase/recombinase XerC
VAGAIVAPAAITPADLIGHFLSSRSKRTIQAYRQDLEDFRQFIGAGSIDQAAAILIGSGHGQANGLALSYLAYLRDRGLQAATINRRLAALRSLVKLARTLGLVPWALEISNLKAKSYRDTQGPGRDGFHRLLAAAAAQKNGKGARDRAILRLLYDLALRRGEVVALNLADLDLETGKLAVLGKGQTEKLSMTLPEPTKKALTDWLTVRGTEPGPLFYNFDHAGKGRRLTGTSLYRLIRRLGEKSGIKTRPHGLRHTAITEACKIAQVSDIGLEEVLDFSRHADIRVLLVYRDRERNVQGRLSTLVAGAVADPE